MSRDPARFVTLIDGTTGVNFIYDSWRYLKALVRGERFRQRTAIPAAAVLPARTSPEFP
jgi:hypothetical protein